jgi:trk system potassium uptake protein TrkA
LTSSRRISPSSSFRKTIGELHLRSRYHIEVIAIREMLPERLTMVPRAEFVIKDSDVLVVIGKEKDIQKIK